MVTAETDSCFYQSTTGQQHVTLAVYQTWDIFIYLFFLQMFEILCCAFASTLGKFFVVKFVHGSLL